MKSVRPDLPPAHRAIRAMIAAIPRGRVANYGEIARRAGLPGRARLVGTVLREAPATLGLPWFRVLRADGRIAFPPGSKAFREQVRHLAGEGVLVRGGRVDLAVHGWERDVDHLLWGPPAPPARRRRERAKT
ncbi:MGMT family protein [Dokdonella fugitiva]|jgi:methylated-DNA-protein-cysteine methyltransferase-like protein|nr:MGMT family protein [Dokdonella fugitiva]